MTTATSPSMPLCLAFALAGIAAALAPAYAADSALDWNKAAPSRGSVSPPLAPTGEAVTPASRALVPPAGSAFGNRPAERLTEQTKTHQKTTAVAATRSASGLFALDDRAIIIVGGKSTTAGAVKQAINAELAAKAGPPKTVKGGARKIDLAAIGVKSASSGTQAAGQKTMNLVPGGVGGFGGARKPGVSQVATATPSPINAAQVGRLGVKDSVASTNIEAGTAAARCPTKDAPQISEVAGKLKAGSRVTVWGKCFGDRPGRIEIIGQFSGGKLSPAFAAWDNTGVELEIPATIRGANDHIVAVTIVTADGKTSPAMQTQFVAARERIEVPARLWSPGADFELAATAETSNQVDPYEVNRAYAGRTAMTLRVQPQCTLDTMDAIVHSGSITGISGWEAGLPNEASVTIDWLGTCTGTKTSTAYSYVIGDAGVDVSIKSACRVAFQTQAWAYCPVGIAP